MLRTIQSRLLLLLVFVAVLFLSAAALEIYNLQKSKDSLRHVYEDRSLSTLYLSEISENVYTKIVKLLDHSLSSEKEKEQRFEKFTLAKQKILDAWRNYSNTYLTEKELTLMHETQGYLYECLGWMDEYVKSPEEKKKKKILDYVDQILPRLHALQMIQVEETAVEYEKASKSLERHKLEIAFMLLWGITLTLLLGLPIIHKLSHSLKRVTFEIDEIAKGKGDLSLRLPVEGDDELAQLRQSFNRLMAQQEQLVKTVFLSEKHLKELCSSLEEAMSGLEKHISHTQDVAREITDSARSISITSHEMVQNIDELELVSKKTNAISSSGGEALRSMQESLEHLEREGGHFRTKLAHIEERASNIEFIIETMSRIAEQTELLSLNAAIQAERAGVEGKEFSALAQEIRRLADQSAHSLQEIRQSIHEMGSSVKSGVKAAEQFTQDLQKDGSEMKILASQLLQITKFAEEFAPQLRKMMLVISRQEGNAAVIASSVNQLKDASENSVEYFTNTVEKVSQMQGAMNALQKKIERFTFSKEEES